MVVLIAFFSVLVQEIAPRSGENFIFSAVVWAHDSGDRVKTTAPRSGEKNSPLHRRIVGWGYC